VKSLETTRVRQIDVHKPGYVYFFGRQGATAVQREKAAEAATVAFNPIVGGGSTSPSTIGPPATNEGHGTYSTKLRLGAQPMLNRVEISAKADVWVPYFDLKNGTATPLFATQLGPGQSFQVDQATGTPVPVGQAFKLTDEAFAVRATVNDRTVLIGSSGGTTVDAPIDYTIEPPGYAAQSAQVDLLKSVFPNDQWIGFLPGDHMSGSGQAVVRQGTGFDPFSRYRTQLVLNRGTDVEVKSDSHDLNAYLVAPFGLDFRSRHTIAEHARQPDDIDLAKELGAETAELTTVISNGLVAAGQACGGLPAGLSMIEQGSG